MLAASILTLLVTSQSPGIDWRPVAMSGVSGSVEKNQFLLESSAIAVRGDSLGSVVVEDRWNRKRLDLGAELFEIRLKGGRSIRASETGRKSPYRIEPLGLHPKRGTGFRITRSYEDTVTGLVVEWSMIVSEQAHYLRSLFALRSSRQPVDVSSIKLLRCAPGNPRAVEATGLAGFWFMREESGKAQPAVRDGLLELVSQPEVQLARGQTLELSTVVGVVPEGQRRRAISRYVDAERDGADSITLNFVVGSKRNSDSAVSEIRQIGTELQSRNVRVDEFVLTHWELPNEVAVDRSRYPEGLRFLNQTTLRFNSGLALATDWFGQSADHRVVGGSSPKAPRVYQSQLLEYVFRMVEASGVKALFQISPSDWQGGYQQQRRDAVFEQRFNTGLKGRFPDLELYGGSPISSNGGEVVFRTPANVEGLSPFWQRLIGQDHAMFVESRGVEPLRSSVIDATDPEFAVATVRAAFTSGMRNPLLKLDPARLTKTHWDQLGKTARWAKANVETLRDMHFIGGDPAQGEVYGFAGWSPKKSILTLRNPSSKPQAYALSLAAALELPMGYRSMFKGVSPWPEESARPIDQFDSKAPKVIILQPFEVRTWELTPYSVEPK